MKRKERILEIAKLREELLNELRFLQETCPHEEYYVGNYSWRIGSYDLMRICNICDSVKLGKPSDKEIEEYSNEMSSLKKEWVKTGKPYTEGKGSLIYKNNI